MTLLHRNDFRSWRQLALLLAPLLSGCVAIPVTSTTILGADAGLIYLTKPAPKGPPDTEDQIVAHESWCYRTIGEPQCFSRPQDIPAERLIMVDPPNAYPLDVASYQEAVVGQSPPGYEPAIAAVPPGGGEGPPTAILDPSPEHVSPRNRFEPLPPPPDWVPSPVPVGAPLVPAAAD